MAYLFYPKAYIISWLSLVNCELLLKWYIVTSMAGFKLDSDVDDSRDASLFSVSWTNQAQISEFGPEAEPKMHMIPVQLTLQWPLRCVNHLHREPGTLSCHANRMRGNPHPICISVNQALDIQGNSLVSYYML